MADARHPYREDPMMRTQASATPPWDGAPVTLAKNEFAGMEQTPYGSTVLAFQNLTDTNSDGELTLTSASSQPQALTATAGVIAPTILVHSWSGSDLKLTNTSVVAVPINVRLVGPGIPGVTPKFLPTGKDGLVLRAGEAACGESGGGTMRLVMTLNSGAPGILAVIGGPKKDAAGDNACVYALNMPSSSRMPAGYEVVTSGTTASFDFTWAGRIFVAFFGPASLAAAALSRSDDLPQATVTLLSL